MLSRHTYMKGVKHIDELVHFMQSVGVHECAEMHAEGFPGLQVTPLNTCKN